MHAHTSSSVGDHFSYSSRDPFSDHLCPSVLGLPYFSFPAISPIILTQLFLRQFTLYPHSLAHVRGHQQFTKWMNEARNKWKTFWRCYPYCFHCNTTLAYLAQMVFISEEQINLLLLLCFGPQPIFWNVLLMPINTTMPTKTWLAASKCSLRKAETIFFFITQTSKDEIHLSWR